MSAAALRIHGVGSPLAEPSIASQVSEGEIPLIGAYQAMTLAQLADFLRRADSDAHRWRLVAEFLQEYRHEPVPGREALLETVPESVADERWDVFLGALAEHMSVR